MSNKTKNRESKKVDNLGDLGTLFGNKLQNTQHNHDKDVKKLKNNYSEQKNNSNDNVAPLIPINKGTIEALKKNTANFSLSFVRLMEWQIGGNTTTKVEDPKDLKDQNHSVISAKKFCDDANKKLPNIQNELDIIHNRQKEIINQLGVFPIEIKAKLISPFISGLGAGHPNETGMILDRNTGSPLIPASSIKGVLRLAYAVKLAEENPSLLDEEGKFDDKELDKYFGSTDTNNAKRGQLVILDAYPAKAPQLKLDIMNSHYDKYYRQEDRYKLPIETEDPKPIKFISVEKGAEFIFRTLFLPLNESRIDEGDRLAIKAAFEKAFSVIGFGGKTAVGYGRFQITSDN
ncbi:MAG: type III-B CRISPR module RAMP protein Cmr6 [Campylobacteraceae bacterium]|jgi:CRISPR-associated protein Cmr6|nr:type III-B CRISPR module RAMP protein Cmr6 [Campylobacteraceae bacterium]